MKKSIRHIGFIPDGNRRWALQRGMEKQSGYSHGLEPGYELYGLCKKAGINEISVYGFTTDNTRRPGAQKKEFTECCVRFAQTVWKRGAALLVCGDESSANFPPELLRFRKRRGRGMKVNLLINYGWEWDLRGLRENGKLRSSDISPIDLIVRWGGRRRLSGFLPAQSVYADFHVIEDYWPDFKPDHFKEAVEWYSAQDPTLGG